MENMLICECGNKISTDITGISLCTCCMTQFKKVDNPDDTSEMWMQRYNLEERKHNSNWERANTEIAEEPEVLWGIGPTDIIKYFDVHNIRTVHEVAFKESLVPLKGQDIIFHNCDNPDDLMSVTAALTGYIVLNVSRAIYNDGTVVVHVDVKDKRDLK
jgi:hypothetical protein